MTDHLQDAIAKLRADLDWRGPNGRAMGHVCLRCDQAQALLAAVAPGVIKLKIENQQTISEWAEATFGPVGSNLSVATRANKEFGELLHALAQDDNHPKAAEEAADVIIVLMRLFVRLGIDMDEQIDRKMQINRGRQWQRTGGGHGQHIETPAKRWRHVKRGSTYTEIGRGKLQDGDAGGLSNNQEMVIYRSDEDGSLWCRAVDEFEDGRFIALDGHCDHAGADFTTRRLDRHMDTAAE